MKLRFVTYNLYNNLEYYCQEDLKWKTVPSFWFNENKILDNVTGKQIEGIYGELLE